VDPAGNIYIADTLNQRVRKISNGIITTIAGNGTAGFGGDGGPAESAELNYPNGIALDAAGDLCIAETADGRIRKITNGSITTVAGNGTLAFGGDGGPATGVQLNRPFGVAVDSSGNLYVADTYNDRIRKIVNGVIATVAGNGTERYFGDNGPAGSAMLSLDFFGSGVAADSAGNV
jgi:sugar lactone lactonase YvrE